MNRHGLDPLSLVAGAVFMALGLAYLAGGRGAELAAVWGWPVLAVGLGVGLLGSLWVNRRSRRR